MNINGKEYLDNCRDFLWENKISELYIIIKNNS